MKSLMDYLESFVFRVNYTGQKLKKLDCPPGYHPNADGTACIPMSSDMKHNLKLGAKAAVRDKKSQGDSLKRMVAKRTKKAMKFRAMFGLTP